MHMEASTKPFKLEVLRLKKSITQACEGILQQKEQLFNVQKISALKYLSDQFVSYLSEVTLDECNAIL